MGDKLIKTWIVICDREIDATKESFVDSEDGQFCHECANGEEPKTMTFLVKWTGVLAGSQKVKAANRWQAMKKAEENPNIKKDEGDPHWCVESAIEINGCLELKDNER